MRAIALALLVLVAACGAKDEGIPPAQCMGTATSCDCNHESVAPAPGAMASTCGTSVAPGTACCADSSWPSDGTCSCYSVVIYCGVVPGYFPAQSGEGAQDACVCSSDQDDADQSVGATCYPGGTTTSDGAVGTCCNFPADAPGAVGEAACICAAGLHTCASGGTAVATCDETELPAVSSACDEGMVPVTTCL